MSEDGESPPGEGKKPARRPKSTSTGPNRRKGGGEKYSKDFVERALETYPAYNKFEQLQKKMLSNPYFVVSRGTPFDGEVAGKIIDITEAGLRKIIESATRGLHISSIADELGLPPSTFRELRKRFPEIEDALEVARGREHDLIYAPIREAALNGDPKMLTNNVAIMNSKFGWKQGEERFAGEKREQVGTNVNIQIVQLPQPMSRADYNKMSEDPVEFQKFLGPAVKVTTTEAEEPSDGPDDDTD